MMTHLYVSMILAGLVSIPTLAYGDGPAPAASASSAPAPAPAPAPSPRQRFAGSFAYVGGEKEIAARDAAIDAATASMFFATRGMARSKVRERTPVERSFQFSFPAGSISFIAAGQPPAVSPETGGTVAYKSSSGADLRLSQRITTDGKIGQTFTGENGSRSVVFVLSADGNTLWASHTVSSSKLPQSIHYTLTYRRT